jgi:hypothetical protein
VKALTPDPPAVRVPEWVYVVVIVAAVAPSTFLVWLCAAGAVHAGRVRRWQLFLAAPVTALPLVVIEPATALEWALNSYDLLGATGPQRSGWELALTVLLVLVRLLVVSLPLGLPLGLATAAIKTPPSDMVAPALPNPRVRAVWADARARRQRVVGRCSAPPAAPRRKRWGRAAAATSRPGSAAGMSSPGWSVRADHDPGRRLRHGEVDRDRAHRLPGRPGAPRAVPDRR